MAIEWNNNLATGISKIDAQHRELFKIMNNLIEACNSGRGREVLGNTIRFLENYVLEHFSNEENLMEMYNYPETGKHRLQHYEFIKNFNEIKREFEKEGPGVHIVILTNSLVVNWFINHIKKIDILLGKYLRERGVE